MPLPTSGGDASPAAHALVQVPHNDDTITLRYERMTHDTLGRLSALTTDVASCQTPEGGLRTRFQYDAFGNQIASQLPTGVVSTTQSTWCHATQKTTGSSHAPPTPQATSPP